MFEGIKKNLYFSKLKANIIKGVKDGTIVPFEDELYSRLDNIYFCGATLTIRLKYLKPMKGMPGMCEDRSLFILAGFDDATLVQANIKSLELEHGSENAWHCFVEHDGWVYDPSSLYKFRKDIYYKLFKPTNVSTFDSSEYKKWPMYNEVVCTSLEDLKSNNVKKINFYMGIYGVKALADISNDENFKTDFYNMLEVIDYKPFNMNDDICELIMSMK